MMTRLEELKYAIRGADPAVKVETERQEKRYRASFLDVTYDEETYVVVTFIRPWREFALTLATPSGGDGKPPKDDDTITMSANDIHETAAKVVEMLRSAQAKENR